MGETRVRSGSLEADVDPVGAAVVEFHADPPVVAGLGLVGAPLVGVVVTFDVVGGSAGGDVAVEGFVD